MGKSFERYNEMMAEDNSGWSGRTGAFWFIILWFVTIGGGIWWIVDGMNREVAEREKLQEAKRKRAERRRTSPRRETFFEMEEEG
jgi:hypothetical protein